jgi:Class III signal peptide.
VCVRRGQASIEYVLLISALMVAICLLVRYPTPVQWLARSVAHAVSQPPVVHRPHGGKHHHGSPHRRPHPCLCLPTRGSPGG